jgi:predicted Rossmann-fold nucleotide-binding protein
VSGTPGLDLTAVVHARVSPKGVLDNLSQQEVDKLLDRGQGGLYPLFRRCALAVLNSGTLIDDARLIFEAYKDFELRIVREPWGIKLEMQHAPGSAFVDGEMIRGVKEHLFAVLRDIVYTHNEIVARFDLDDSASVTNAIFCILRNARALEYKGRPDLVVCWGGHSIPREEYDYTKQVGYELGLRGLSVCTGCGPGAMKGPDEGRDDRPFQAAHQGRPLHRHHRARHHRRRAAEPDRQPARDHAGHREAPRGLRRLCHGIIVFPGGAGTAEEILYLLGILLDPANASQPLPLVFTGPRESAGYFRQLDRFIGLTLGAEAQQRYRIIVDDPPEVAREMQRGFDVRAALAATGG